MAFELYGMLAGSVSPTTGENVKPAYGGDEEAFLRKVVTPIYNVIAKVSSCIFCNKLSPWNILHSPFSISLSVLTLTVS